MAVSPFFKELLERRHGVLTFRMTQVLTVHGKFGRFLHLIRAEETPGCHHCPDHPENTVEHSVEVCPAWAEHRRILVGAIGGGDLSRRAMVQAMVQGEGERAAVASFCQAVMLAKKAAARVKERTSSRPSHQDPDPDLQLPILWVAATALATWGAVDVSLGQLQRYNESPTVVTLEKDFRSWRFSVPAITMCYKNRLNKAKLPAAIKKYFNTEPSDEKYDYYVRLVEAITDSDLFHLQRFQEFNHLDNSVNMFGIAVDVMPELDIKTRSSQEVTYKWIPVMTEAGACYVTNSLALGDVAIATPNLNDTVRWPETCKYSSLSCYIVMDVPASADFYVHSPYDVMDLTHSPSHVRLTLVRTTELSVMESRCGRGVEELQPTRRGCSYTNEPSSSGRKVHSTNTCRLSCRSILAKKFCNCVPFYYFYDDGPQCTPKGMACLSNYSHKLSNNNGQKCACAPQCIDSIYKEISTVDQIWDRPPFNVHGSIKFAVQAPRTRYTREIVFHFQDLVVSFGGAAGLFLGASFISFVEILYFLLARPFRTTIRREEKKHINKTTAVLKVKQLPVSHETLRINQLTAILDAQKKYDAVPEYYY